MRPSVALLCRELNFVGKIKKCMHSLLDLGNNLGVPKNGWQNMMLEITVFMA